MSEYIDVFKRTEIKYYLTSEKYKMLRDFLSEYARVDDYGKTRINNIYFDTPDYRMIRTSLDKPVYKEKLRLRTYGETNDLTNAFIEIKKKYDGIVYKRRVAGPYRRAYDYLINGGRPLDDSQISREIEGLKQLYEEMIPAMTICYDRIAMIGLYDPVLRITFDTNIRWDKESTDLRRVNNGNIIVKDGDYLMEIKVTDAMPLFLARKLSELEIFPVSFSKYGRAYMDMTGIYEMSGIIEANDASHGISNDRVRINTDINKDKNSEREVMAYA